MAIFDPIRLEWSGKEYTLPAGEVLRTIAQIEDVITLGDLAHANFGRVPLAKLSMAFGIVLRAAGARVTDEQVYNDLFAQGGEALHQQAIGVVFALQALMIPPEHLRAKAAASPPADEKKSAAPA